MKEWVRMLAPRTEIRNRFKNFLRNSVTSKGQFIYKEKIRRMCESNHSSFEVQFSHLAVTENALAYFLPEAPMEMLEIFDEVAKELVLAIYPMYERVTSEIHVRISDLPLTEDIRTFRFAFHFDSDINEKLQLIDFFLEQKDPFKSVSEDHRCGQCNNRSSPPTQRREIRLR